MITMTLCYPTTEEFLAFAKVIILALLILAVLLTILACLGSDTE